jgi:NitT/TauT family transport system substrate-binding protein
MYHNLNNTIPIILISNFIVLLISQSFTSIDAQITPVKEPIRLGIPLWVPDFLAHIAQEKGYFKKNNVDVNLIFIQDYANMTNKYTEGVIDGTFMVYPDVIIHQSSGIDTKVVYNLDLSSYADAIVGNGNNLSDVKGKKISVDGINTYSHYFLLKSLEKVGLSEADIEFVDIPAQNVTSALQKGEIFAATTYEPFVSDAVKKGFKILYFAANIPGTMTDVLAFHSDIVQQRPLDIQI